MKRIIKVLFVLLTFSIYAEAQFVPWLELIEGEPLTTRSPKDFGLAGPIESVMQRYIYGADVDPGTLDLPLSYIHSYPMKLYFDPEAKLVRMERFYRWPKGSLTFQPVLFQYTNYNYRYFPSINEKLYEGFIHKSSDGETLSQLTIEMTGGSRPSKFMYQNLRFPDQNFSYLYTYEGLNSEGNLIAKRYIEPSDFYILVTMYKYENNRLVEEKVYETSVFRERFNVPLSRTTYTYNEQGLIEEIIFKAENSIAGSNYTETNFSYDSKNQMTTKEVIMLIWPRIKKITTEYYQNGKLQRVEELKVEITDETTTVLTPIYNDKGYLVEGPGVVEPCIRYTEFDPYGNWTLCETSTRTNNIPNTVSRTFTYYP